MQNTELVFDLKTRSSQDAAIIAKSVSILDNVCHVEVATNLERIGFAKNRLVITIKPDLHPQELFKLGSDVMVVVINSSTIKVPDPLKIPDNVAHRSCITDFLIDNVDEF